MRRLKAAFSNFSCSEEATKVGNNVGQNGGVFMKSEKREKKNENRKMKTPVYDGEGWKISPSCPI